MKRQKEHKAMVEALAKGDEVVTSGGMLGRVSKMGETYVHIEVANGVGAAGAALGRRAGSCPKARAEVTRDSAAALEVRR